MKKMFVFILLCLSVHTIFSHVVTITQVSSGKGPYLYLKVVECVDKTLLNINASKHSDYYGECYSGHKDCESISASEAGDFYHELEREFNRLSDDCIVSRFAYGLFKHPAISKRYVYHGSNL